MNLPVVLPFLIPLGTIIATLFTVTRRSLQRGLSLAGALGLLAAAINLLATVWRQGIQVVYVGSWPAPHGITVVADLLSAIMVLLAATIGLTVVVYSLADIDAERESYGYHPLYHALLLGICGAFLAGDMFNLYVWFEVMLMSSFVLLTMGGGRSQFEGGIKYVTLNLMSSAIFLAAVGILYGFTGTLNMADLAGKLPDLEPAGLTTTLAMLFLVAFGIKAAIFPLFAWLPASYYTPPAAVSAIFAGLLTKVGAYSLIRVFTLLFINDVAYTHTIILVIAGFTMTVGVLGAAAQNDFRRILSFHIVSQIGYMIMGLALFTPLALAATIYFIMHNILAKANLFLISGVAYRLHGTYRLKQLGELYQLRPGLAFLFLISAMSLAGLPPLSGFWAKLALIQAGLAIQQYVIVAVALGVSVMTLYSMIKIWTEAFWKDRGEAAPPLNSLATWEKAAYLLPVATLATLTVLIGIGFDPVYTVIERAAADLMNPSTYIQAVLGG